MQHYINNRMQYDVCTEQFPSSVSLLSCLLFVHMPQFWYENNQNDTRINRTTWRGKTRPDPISGASLNAIDLLPSPSAPNSWTKDLRTDDGKESDEVFAFDGKKDAIEVSEEMNEVIVRTGKLFITLFVQLVQGPKFLKLGFLVLKSSKIIWWKS